MQQVAKVTILHVLYARFFVLFYHNFAYKMKIKITVINSILDQYPKIVLKRKCHFDVYLTNKICLFCNGITKIQLSDQLELRLVFTFSSAVTQNSHYEWLTSNFYSNHSPAATVSGNQVYFGRFPVQQFNRPRMPVQKL